MAIIITLDQQAFVNMFADYNRADQFSIEARRALFDYYDELSDDTGEDFQMDAIAICCDWHEYTVQECINDYENLFDPKEWGECCDGDQLDYIESVLNEHTFIIRLEDTLLIQAF